MRYIFVFVFWSIFSLQSFAQSKIIIGEVSIFNTNNETYPATIECGKKAMLCKSNGSFKLKVPSLHSNDTIKIGTIFSIPIYISHFDETKDIINLGEIYLIEYCPYYETTMPHYRYQNEEDLKKAELYYETNVKPKYDSCLTVKEEMLETIHDKKYQLFKQERNSYIFIDYRSCIFNK